MTRRTIAPSPVAALLAATLVGGCASQGRDDDDRARASGSDREAWFEARNDHWDEDLRP
jgi:hypothetical protein